MTKRTIPALLLALVLALGLAACGEESETTPNTVEPTNLTAPTDPSVQSNLTATVGQTAEPLPTEAPTEAPTEVPTEAPTVPPETQSAYTSGSYRMLAIGDNTLVEDELIFEDGQLTIHYYSDENGKGGYGPNCSDALEYSPCYQMSVEEAAAYFEAQGRTVIIEAQ